MPISAGDRVSPVRPVKAAGNPGSQFPDVNPVFGLARLDQHQLAWTSYDPHKSQTADYPPSTLTGLSGMTGGGGEADRASDSMDLQPLIDALTKDKNALEKLHLEGQLENAQLRRQVHEMTDALKDALAGSPPQGECDRCPLLVKELQAANREAGKVRAELLDTATEAEAHKLRCEIFSRDADDAKQQLAQVEQEYAAVKQELSSLQQDNNDLQHRLQAGVSELSNDRAVMLTELEMFRRQVASLEASRSEEALARQTAEGTFQTHEAKIHALEMERDSLMTDLRRMTSDSQSPLPAPPSSHPARSHEPSSASAELSLHKQVATQEAELGHLRHSHQLLQSNAHDAEQKLRDALVEKAMLAGELTALREVGAHAANEDAVQAREQLSQAKEQLMHAREQLSSSQAQLAQAKGQLEGGSDQAAQAAQQLADTTAQLAQAREQLTQATEQLAYTKEQAGETKEQLAQERDDHKQTREQGVHLQESVMQAKEQLSQTKEQLQQEAGEKQRLADQVASVCQQRDALGSEIGTMQRQLASLSEQIQTMEQARSLLVSEKNVAATEAQQKATDNAELQAELALAQERLKTSKEENERLTAKVASQKEKNQRNSLARDELAALKERLRYETQDKTRIQSERDEADRRSRQSEDEVLHQSKRIESLRIELDAMDSQLGTVSSVESTLKAELIQKDQEMHELRTSLEGRVAALQQEIMARGHEFDDLSSTRSSLESDLQEERQRAKEARADLESRLAMLEGELREARRSYREAQGTSESLESSLSSLNHELHSERTTKLSLEERVAQLMGRVQDMSERTARAEQEAAEAEQQAAEAESQVAEAEHLASEATQQAADAEKLAAEAQLIAAAEREEKAELSETVSSLRSEVDGALEKANLANAAKVSLEASLGLMEADAVSGQERLEEVMLEKQRLGEETESLARGRAEDEARARERLEQLGKTLALVQEELSLERSAAQDIEAERDQLLHRELELHEALSDERERNAEIINDLRTELEEALEKLQHQTEGEKDRADAAEASMSSLQASLDDAQQEAEDVLRGERERTVALLAEQSALEADHVTLRAEVEKLRDEAEGERKKTSDLDLLRSALGHELHLEKKKVEDITKRAATAEASLSEQRTQNEVMEARLTAQREELQAVREDTSAAQASQHTELMQLREQLRNTNADLAQMVGKCEAAAAVKKLTDYEMESHLASAKAQLDEALRDKAELEGRSQSLAEQLAVAKRELSDAMSARRTPNPSPVPAGPDPALVHTLEEENSRLREDLQRCERDIRGVHTELENRVAERDKALREAATAREEAEGLARVADEWRTYAGRFSPHLQHKPTGHFHHHHHHHHQHHQQLPQHPYVSPRRSNPSTAPTVEDVRSIPTTRRRESPDDGQVHELESENVKFAEEIQRLSMALDRCVSERDRAVREVVATREEADALSRMAEEWRHYATRVGVPQRGADSGQLDLSTLHQALSGQPFISLKEQLLQRCTSPTIPPSTAALVTDCLTAYPPGSPASDVSSPYLARAASPSRLAHT